MTNKEANSKVTKLFNKWCKEFRNYGEVADKDFYERLELFKKECSQVHNIVGIYDVLTDKNALKMASICSSVRFVEPYRMLMELQRTTKTY